MIIGKEELEKDIKDTYLKAQEVFEEGRKMLKEFNNRLVDKSVDIKSFANVLPALLKSVVESNINVFEIQQYFAKICGHEKFSGAPEGEQKPVVDGTNITSISQAVNARKKNLEKMAKNRLEDLDKAGSKK